MTNQNTTNVDPAELARARLAVYRFLLAAMDRPTPTRYAWLCGCVFSDTMRGLCDRFGIPVPEEPLFPPDYAQYEAQYIASFEVGVPMPPVVLQASRYNRCLPAPQVIHEHLVMYRWFQARLAEGNLDPADGLLNELAFLIHLDQLLEGGAIPSDSIHCARADFLRRHAAVWPAQAAEQARIKHLPGVYQTLLALHAAAVDEDLRLVELLHGEAAHAS